MFLILGLEILVNKIMLKYFIKTFGCQMNFSDSERLASFLEKNNNFKPAKKIDEANLVIFNSCGVRKMPEDRAFGQIHNLRKHHPQIKIALTGCIAHRPDVQSVLKKKVDLFFSIKNFNSLRNFIAENYPKTLAKKNNQITNKNISYLSINPKFTNNFSAYVPIMTGCNNFCAYCVVPYARGREISRPTNEVLDEIKNLIKNGCKEITLLGQNVNSYNGKFPIPNTKCQIKSKNSEGINFAQLLKIINKIPGKFWIRFMTSHPKDMSYELIQSVTKLNKVCESIHLPIQSGDDQVLARMNRHYTRAHYLNLIKKIKKGFKKNKPTEIYSLSSDIIVGFPEETEVQLEKSALVMCQVKYDMVYFGQFSPRPQTMAWKMKDNVSKTEKEKREKYLNDILKRTTSINNKKYLGKTFEILIETEKEGQYFGKTRTLKNVKIISKKKNLIGKFAKIKITKATIWSLEGKLL